MSGWQRVQSLAERECETCRSARRHVSAAGVTHLFCTAADVLQAMGRQWVAATVARDEVCGGKLWKLAR